MMSGAWIAAMQDSTRFSKINGYGSKARTASTVFMTIHSTKPPVNEKINAQLPANLAMASAARCPSVYFSVPLSGLTEILLSASRFSTSSSVISRRISLSTSFNSFRFSFIAVIPLSWHSLRYAKRNQDPFSNKSSEISSGGADRDRAFHNTLFFPVVRSRRTNFLFPKKPPLRAGVQKSIKL